MTRGLSEAVKLSTCPRCGTPDRLAIYDDGVQDCKTCNYREQAVQTGISDY